MSTEDDSIYIKTKTKSDDLSKKEDPILISPSLLKEEDVNFDFEFNLDLINFFKKIKIIDNLKEVYRKINFHVVCDNFHKGLECSKCKSIMNDCSMIMETCRICFMREIKTFKLKGIVNKDLEKQLLDIESHIEDIARTFYHISCLCEMCRNQPICTNCKDAVLKSQAILESLIFSFEDKDHA